MSEQASLQDQLRDIEAAIQAREGLRGTLTDDELDVLLQPLYARRQALKVQIESGAVAIGAGAQAVGQKGIFVEGSIGGDLVGSGGILIKGDVYMGPRPHKAEEALAIYRRVICQTTASLPLRGVDVGASDPTATQHPLGLINVYVDLDTTAHVKIQKERQERRDEPDLLEGRDYRSLSALEATVANRYLVLLGDPGGGKTTFVRFLAHCLAAHQLEPEGGWLEQLPGWPKEQANILPILVILRDFAMSLSHTTVERPATRRLWDFITARLEAQKLEFAIGPLQNALERGEALVLLDGLDEIPTRENRLFVRDTLHAFIQRFPQNRYLATCRILSYQPPESPGEPDLRLDDLPDYTLAPFDDDKIDAFIQAWYSELAHLGSLPSQEAGRLARRLQAAVRRPDLWRLASNPLLLTVIALVHTHKGRLPEARAVLYEEAVDILLWRWEQVKLGGQEGTPLLRQLLLEAGRSEVDLKRVLWELAYEAQASSQLDDDESLADIGELRLQKALAGLKDGDHNWARQVVAAIKLRAGLLLERSPEVFSFPHRTFQEYLAGAHLAAQANFASNATELTLQGVQWREVILLAVGRLVYLTGDMDKPLALVGELCPAQPGEDEIAWQRAWLAADVLAEMGVNRVKDSALGRDLLERVRMRLVDLLSQGKLSVIERAHAGDTLAALGDPRFDPETWYLPDEPMFGFVEIPAGPFLMGSDPLIDPDAYDDEQPQQDVNLLAYYIARYPVTKAQFRAFVDDSGYQPRDQDSLRGLSNHPVVYVSWHDALAYCEWLNKKLREKAQQFLALGMADENQRLFWEGLVNGELRVTLPSEAEWEKAARGTSASIYPWGAQIDAERANCGETGIGGTSAVGCFPGGASPYGVQDLSGNVREWTHSLFKPYPYNPEDGREELESDDPRVLRGGAFLSHHWHVRCAYRYRHYPDLRNVGFGFCVVVSPSQL